MIRRTFVDSAFRGFPLVVLLSFAMSECAFAVVIIQSAINPANLHNYHLLAADDGFSGVQPVDAEAFALNLGGHLATINDAAEDVWVHTTFNEFYLWIGLNDVAQEGQFVWYSGEPVTYTNWYPSEPNDNGGIEDWVQIYNFSSGGYQWNDGPNIAFNGFEVYAVAEVVPEPSSSVLAALGLVGLVAWRRLRR